ncbi:MAG: hypothetical protein ACI944_001507, partial [Natronomonas sp.]
GNVSSDFGDRRPDNPIERRLPGTATPRRNGLDRLLTHD